MSADISIVHVDSIEENKLTINCYLINPDGELRYDFSDDTFPGLKGTGLTLLISLIENYSNDFQNTLLKKYPTPKDAFGLGSLELDKIIKGASIESFNLDYDLDILDDSDHPDYPDFDSLGSGWDIYDKSSLEKEIISDLPMVSITLVFQSTELLKDIPEGIWNFSAYDTSLDWI